MSFPYDTERSMEVTKVSIVLKDTVDWRNWYQYQKQLAGARGIWKYTDPDGTDEFYMANKEPSEPSLENDLEEKEREVYKEAMALWEKRLANFKTLKKVYEGFSLQILGTIATEHLFMIISEISPRRRIQILRCHGHRQVDYNVMDQ
ncbi:hypothetical protein EJ04DRAFT_501892 [Polyplosphaeria fusca]|uniref:Uncharacterized protein n=1 Tax=Polyplosphaeria fusca TaxID=682080 RepID=A0A9P4UV70_9PLEO|nr:hypothetical protein EJ04DRAFT_501892 [Polyplosphaeria fusca]